MNVNIIKQIVCSLVTTPSRENDKLQDALAKAYPRSSEVIKDFTDWLSTSVDKYKTPKKGVVYFVSGHRDITLEEFREYYIPALEKAMKEPESSFVVGDCAGVDKMAMDYLVQNAEDVTVYHMFDSPRCTPLDMGYQANVYCHTKFIGGFSSDIERDTAMTLVSDKDIAWVRPGTYNSGTQQNIDRRRNKDKNKIF